MFDAFSPRYCVLAAFKSQERAGDLKKHRINTMKILKNGLAIIGLLSLVYIIVAAIPRPKPDDIFATPNAPILSPSGQYQLQVVAGFNGVIHFQRFYIADVKKLDHSFEPEVIYASKDTYRTKDRLFFIWGPGDSVWVYSGDTGIYYWNKSGKNDWEKYCFINGKGQKIPPTLERLISK